MSIIKVYNLFNYSKVIIEWILKYLFHFEVQNKFKHKCTKYKTNKWAKYSIILID